MKDSCWSSSSAQACSDSTLTTATKEILYNVSTLLREENVNNSVGDEADNLNTRQSFNKKMFFVSESSLANVEVKNLGSVRD